MLRYVAAAAALGAGWFVVLLLPAMTRDWLLAAPWRNGGLLVVSSVLVAVALRRFIASAETTGQDLLRAVLMPLAGAVVYLTLCNAAIWAESLIRGGLANAHDTLSLYVMGLAATVLSCFVVVPYGWLCQTVMNRLAPDE